MARVQRLFEVVVKRKSKPHFTVGELAEEFHVSRRTMLRDLRSLSEMGAPLAASPGPHGGYSLIMRRMRLKRDKEFAGLRILSEADSREGRQLDDFLEKNHIPHRLVEVKTEQGAAPHLVRAGRPRQESGQPAVPCRQVAVADPEPPESGREPPLSGSRATSTDSASAESSPSVVRTSSRV